MKILKAWNEGNDSLLRKWNGFEELNVLNFGKILLEFEIILKFLNIFVLFRVKRSLLVNQAFQDLQMGYLAYLQRQK